MILKENDIMLSNEFINKIVAGNEIVLNEEEFESELFNGDHWESDNHYITDVTAEACIEELSYNGFSEDEIIKLFDGRYLHDGGGWGPIPHIARLYTDDQRSYYILTLEVAG